MSATWLPSLDSMVWIFAGLLFITIGCCVWVVAREYRLGPRTYPPAAGKGTPGDGSDE